MKPLIHVAANGHLSMEFDDIPRADWEALVDRLIRDYNFQRIGSPVLGFDEQIYPSLQHLEFTLAAGWDNWSGYYLLSESECGDEFLRRLSEDLEY